MERLTQSPKLSGGTVTTTVDATGLGIVVSEDLRRRRLRGELYPVAITGGLEGKYRDGFYPTPRTELLIGVQTARGLRIETLGQHDDLVFALALALFGVRMRTLPVVGEAVRRRIETDAIADPASVTLRRKLLQ